MNRGRGSLHTARTKRGDAPSRGKPDRAYAVGYGRPPIESRFQPGTSGNPRGRRKGSKNLKTLSRKAMTASISIQEGTKTRRVSKIEGVVLRQLQSAIDPQWPSLRWQCKWACSKSRPAALPRIPR